MQPSTNLEIKGNLREHPFAELLVEIRRHHFNGALRVNAAQQKTVVYFDAGDVVFAVSNARSARLGEILRRENKVTAAQLAKFADTMNDLALSQNLIKAGLLSKAESEQFFVRQIGEILTAAFEWSDGEWSFSPLVRVKNDVRLQIALPHYLIEHARRLSPDEIAARFKNVQETFRVKSAVPVNINLNPQEAFVFSRFEEAAELTVEQVQQVSGLPPSTTFAVLYVLWLSGFLERQTWNTAFSAAEISAIGSARLALKKDALPSPVIAASSAPPSIAAATETPTLVEKTPLKELSLPDYLTQINQSANHYEMLGLAPDVETAAIKQAYFGLAKKFHPDLFHRSTDAQTHQQIQNAFSKIAQAYDILKTPKTREFYDFKVRKELAQKTLAAQKSQSGDEPTAQNEQAAEFFERGFSLLLDENFDAATPFLARAAHLAPDNARFHAYYGKALAGDQKQRHKAETEMQTAVRLDTNNPDYRLMLAEFFVQMKLLKRAEGELNRLLEIIPDNKEAKLLLDNLAVKQL